MNTRRMTMIQNAFIAGFAASGEGFNGEIAREQEWGLDQYAEALAEHYATYIVHPASSE